jgi:putative ABC transport system permease protein
MGKRYVPSYTADLGFWNLGLAFFMVLIIAGVSSLLAIRKVIRVQPFEILRG